MKKLLLFLMLFTGITFAGWEVVEDEMRLLSPDGTELLSIYRDIDNQNVVMNWTLGDLFMLGGDVDLTVDDLTTSGLITAEDVLVTSLTANSGVYTDGSSKLVSTAPTTGILGYWTRTGTTLSMTNPADLVSLGGDITAVGTGTFGTVTDGTASLTGGVGTGYTLNSPVIAGNWSWTGDDVDLDCTDLEKTVLLGANGRFQFTGFENKAWLDIDPSGNAITFGNEIDNPTFAFDGTGTVSMGGDLDVTGVVKSESGRIPKDHLLTANTTIDETYDEVFCDTDSAGFTVTLPATPVGQRYRIINCGSNTLTIDPNGNNIIGSSTNVLLNAGDILIIKWNSTKGWW